MTRPITKTARTLRRNATDASQHTPETSPERTARIESAGWRILRVRNNDSLANTDGVIQALAATLETQACPPRP